MIPYNTWFDEDSYLDEMARAHKLSPKKEIVDVLYREFQKIQSDPKYRPELNTEFRNWQLAQLSGQIVALAMELTDDLAAVCDAYLIARGHGDKRVVEHLANYRMGSGRKFYAKASIDSDFATRAVGLDPTLIPEDQKEKTRMRFNRIQEFREKFWKWYIGYKHAQFATPIVIIAKTPDGKEIQEWGLYLIPKDLQRDQAKKMIHTGDMFINTVGNVDLFVKLAEECVSLWTETRNRQYPVVFHRSIP